MARTQKTVQPPRAFVLACATTDQGQFYNTFEEQIGFGVWYDF